MEMVYVDIETTGLDVQKDKIVCVTFAVGNEEPRITNIKDEELINYLKDTSYIKVFHNAKFDVKFLRVNGVEVNRYEDTMIAAQVLKEKEVSLKTLVFKRFGVCMDKSLQNGSNWRGQILTDKHKEYALNDVIYTRRLYKVLLREIKEKRLLGVYSREISTIDSIVMLELTGIRIDFEAWKQELLKLKKKMDKLEESIKYELKKNSSNGDINLNSPKQLKEALNSLGIPIENTTDKMLAKYSKHKLINHIRRYKKIKKNITTYGSNLIEKSDEDGVLRGNWRQIGCISNRMSCSKPQLQALPSELKKYIRPKDGYSYITADYSNIEARIIAELSGDKNLKKIFIEEVDLHRSTASSLFKKPIEDVTDKQRQVGKTVNFGIIYGISGAGIAKNLIKEGIEVTPKEGERYREMYLESYPDIKKYQNRCLIANKVTSLGGNYWDCKELKPRQRLNIGCQASAAEGLKNSLTKLFPRLKSNWKLANVVHDSITLEVPNEEVEEAKTVLEDTMIEGMKELVKSIPIVVKTEIKKGKENTMEKKSDKFKILLKGEKYNVESSDKNLIPQGEYNAKIKDIQISRDVPTQNGLQDVLINKMEIYSSGSISEKDEKMYILNNEDSRFMQFIREATEILEGEVEEIDLDRLIGKELVVNIEHQKGKDGKLYDNIVKHIFR